MRSTETRTSARRFLRRVLEGDRAAALAAAAVYIVAGATWIALSDRLLEGLAGDASQLTALQTYKGWAFVLGSAVLLYAIVRGSLWLRRRSRRRQREAERFASHLMGNLPGMAYRCRTDAARTLVFVSEGVEELTGHRPEDFQGSRAISWESLVHPEDRRELHRQVNDALAEGTRFRVEYRIRDAAGRERWVWEQGCSVYDEEGRQVALEGFVTDITGRRMAQMELERRKEELERLAAASRELSESIGLPSRAKKVVASCVDGLGARGAALYLVGSNRRIESLPEPRATATAGDPRDAAGVVRPPEAVREAVAASIRGGPPVASGEEVGDASPGGGWRVDRLERQGESLGALAVWGDDPGLSAATRSLFDAYVEQAAASLANARLLEDSRERVARLRALREIDLAITGSLDLRLSLRVVLEQITGRLGVDAADILLLNPHSETLQFVAGRGFRTDALKHTRLSLGQGPAGRAAARRETVTIDDLSIQDGADAFGDSAQIVAEEFVAYLAIPLVAKGTVKGVLEIFQRSPLEVGDEWFDFLETLAGQAAIAVDSAGLFEQLQQANRDLRKAYDETIEGWARALDLRDHETEGHTRRVTELAVRLGRKLGMRDQELVHLRRGALLHDIGKVAIPDEILLKPGPLTDEEWAVMRRHPVYAYKLLSPIEYLRPALDVPYCHHERWDGTGYPQGLRGEQIPRAARVFAVVDVWDALRSDRPYRAAWPEKRVRANLRKGAGSQFDPSVVEAFLEMEPDVIVQAIGGRGSVAAL